MHFIFRDPVTRLILAFAVLLALLAAGIALASPSSAMGKVKCGDSGPAFVASVDPIVHHNETDAMVHQHQFFGNNSWTSKGNAANYADLVYGGTDCRVPVDSAGYWTPTLRYTTGTHQLIPAQQFTAYYRPFTGVGGPDFGPGLPFPADTRLVATKHDWTCGQYMSVPPSQTIPNCTGADGSAGKTLTLHIDFPTCWDGVKPAHASTDQGNTSDNAHYAYSTKKSGVVSCPAGFPNKMIALRETLQFAYVGAGSDVELSSDAMMGGADGSSAHGDFWNTWLQTGLESFVKTCINAKTGYTVAKCQP